MMNNRLKCFSNVIIVSMIAMILAGLPDIAATANWGYYNGSPISWTGQFGSGGDNTWFVSGDNHVHFSDDGSSYDGVRLMRTDSSFQVGSGDLEINYNFGCQATDFYNEPIGDIFMVWDPFPYDAYGDISTAGALRPPLGFMVRKDHTTREVLFNITNSHAGQQNGYDVCCICGDGFVRYDDMRFLVKKEHGGLFLFITGALGTYSVYDYRDFSSTSNPFTIWYDYVKGGVLEFDGFSVVTDSISPITITPTNTHTGNTLYYNAANPPTVSATYSGATTPAWRIDILNSSEESIRGVPADFDEAAYGGSYLQWNSDASISFAWDLTNDAAGAESGTSYTARIAVVDEPNMEAQTQDIELVRDDTAPTSTVAALNTYYGNTAFTVSWTGSDSQSGIASYELKVQKDSGGWTTAYTGTATSYSYTPSGAGTYYFEVCATDILGNAETCSGTSEQSTIVDTTPPVSSAGALDTYYGPAAFTVSWSATDLQTITSYDVQYRKDGGSWTAWLTDTTLTSSSFTHSGAGYYEFEIRAKDSLNNLEPFSGTASVTTTVEETPPTTSMTALSAYSGAGDIAVSWSATDVAPDNGISCYDVQVQKDSGGWTLWQDCTTSTSANYTHSGDGEYEFRTRAKDGVGNWSTFGSTQASTIVDASAPTTSVSALPAYNIGTTISVSWSGSDPAIGLNPGSGFTCYDIQVNKDSGGWTDWLTCTTSTSDTYTHSGGGTYEFRSRATDAQSNVEAWPGTADASTVVDSSPPTFSYVYDGLGTDESFTGSADTLSANWSATDLESGVDHYEYAIGTSSGDTSMVNWTNIGTNTSVTNSSLTLVHDTTYYITIRAHNVAGYYADQSTNGIKADQQAPTASMSEPNAAYTGALDFTVAWSATDGAGESGVQNYNIQYRDGAGGTWTDWTPTPTTDTSRTFNGINGHDYYFRVIAQDNSGNWSVYPSTPDYHKSTTVDTSQPSAPTGISDGATSGNDLDYIADSSSFSAHWTAVSGGIGIQSYAYRIGTTTGTGDIVDWTETTDTFFTQTGLSLTEGTTYYVTVKAKNLAGDFGYEGNSDGITIDLTAPTCSVTQLWEYQGSESFSVQWTGVDSISGIAAYDVQYKDGQGGAWTDWLIATTLTSDLFSGTNGHKYYFQCRATDNASLASSYPGGDGDTFTTLDTTIPVAPDPVIDGATEDTDYSSDVTTLTASWPAVADAAGYKVCFGRGEIPDNCETMDWVDAGTSTFYEKTGLTLTHGETYFARVAAYNTAALEGSPGNSDGVLIDTAKAGTPVVTDDGDYFNTDNILNASWTAEPGISGITEYMYAVGTSAGASDILDWTSAGLETSATISGLPSLTQGQQYFVSVKVVSTVDVWSDAGSSDGIVFDSVAPQCTVTELSPYQLTPTFTVTWSATDEVAGIAYLFDVQVRDGESGQWQDWQSNTSSMAAVYTGIHEHTYYFRCRAMDNSNNWTEYGAGDGDTTTTMDIASEITYTYLPTELKTTPREGEPISVDLEITFSERKGRTITYDQLQEFYVIPGGTVIETPLAETEFKIPGGAETEINWTLSIPADAVAVALGGSTSNIITVRRVYTGLDDLQNKVETTIEIPVSVTTLISEAAFEINTVTISAPEADGKLTGRISASGVGTINGMWLIDGQPLRTFRVNATGEGDVVLEQALASDLTGSHTAQLRVTMPEMIESEKITFEISAGEAAGPTLDAFIAGGVRVTDVTATYDKAFNAWTGTGKVEIPAGAETIKIDAPAAFEKLRVAEVNGQKTLERGFLFVDTNSTFETGPYKVEMDRVLVTATRTTADGKVTYLGTDDVLGVGPLYFYSADVGVSGINGSVELTSPQKGKLGAFQFAIDKVDFEYGPDGVKLNAGGGFKTSPDPVLDFALSINAEGDDASMAVDVANEETINLNGFDFRVESGALVVENDQLVFKCSGNLDLGAAFGKPWNVKVADAKFYAAGNAELSGLESDEVDLGIFSARLDSGSVIAIDDISRINVAAGIDMEISLSADAAGSTIETMADINVTIDGPGEADFIASDGGAIATFETDGATLTLDSGSVTFAGKEIDATKFAGTLSIQGAELSMDNISLENGKLAGNAEGAVSVDAGGIALALSGGVGFEWGADGFSFSADEVKIEADSMIPGASGNLALSDLTVSQSGITAKTSARQSFELKGSSIIVNRAAVEINGSDANVTLDGSISMKDPDINVAFNDLTINSSGTASGEIKADGSQVVKMFGLEFGIEAFTLDMSGDALSLNARGTASFNSESSPIPFDGLIISSGNVKGTMNVSADAPTQVEGFGGLYISKLEFDGNVLSVDGSLELPEPLAKTVDFKDLAFDYNGETENESGGMLILEDESNTPVKIKGFDFHVDRVAVPNFMGIEKTSDIPKTIAKVDIATSQQLCGEEMNVRIKGLEVTADGFRDVRMNVASEASENMYSKVFPDETGLTIAGLLFAIKNSEVTDFDLKGTLSFQGSGYEIPSIEITADGTIQGNVKTGKGLEMDVDGVKLSARGEAAFRVDASIECSSGISVVLKDVEVDFSAPIGAAMKVKVPEMVFENGTLSASGEMRESVNVGGVRFNLTSASFTGSTGAGSTGDDAFVRASFDGSISISQPLMKLAFEGFVVSSDGEIGGDIVLYGAQEFAAYGATFVVDGIKIAKPVAEDTATTAGGEALAIYTKGALSFKAGSTMAYDNLMIAGGKLSGVIEVAKEEAGKAPWAENIGITKVEIRDSWMYVSGFLKVGSPADFELRVEDIAIYYNGAVQGGKVVLEGEEKSFSVGSFGVTVSGASYDIGTRMLHLDGSLQLPKEVTDAALEFTDMGISLAKEGYSRVDTTRMQSALKFLYDKQHILTMQIDRFAVGQKTDDIWYLTMGGTIALAVGQQTVQLDCESFTIFSNGQFDIQGVSGEFAVLIYKFVIENFSFNDEGNNPYIEMSGELDIPPYAAAKVDSFKRYKSGNISFDEVMVYVAYGPLEFLLGLSYHFDAAREIERFAKLMSQGGDSIAKVWESDLNLVTSYEEALEMITSTYGAYKDEEIAIDGTMFINGYGLAVSGYYTPQEWSVDGDVCGLSNVLKIIPTCPVFVFDCLGGGVTYTFSDGLQGSGANTVADNSGGVLSSGGVTELSHFVPDYMQLRLRTTCGFVNTGIDSISGQLSIDTQGMVGVEGEVTLMDLLKVGEATVEFDPYNMYTYGYGEVQAELVDYFPIKLAKAGSVEFMFDADIGGSENQSNSISDYGGWLFGAGAAAYKAAAGENNGQTSSSNAANMAVSGSVGAAGSLSDSSLGDSAWGKLLKGEWDGTSIDWWIKGGYDVDILGGIYTAHAMLTVDKVGWIYDFDVPFTLNISSDDVDRETSFDPANYGFGFDSISIGGAHLTYGLKWLVDGVEVSDSYGVTLDNISANAELFAEFELDVVVDLEVAKAEERVRLKWNNNGTIENVEDDYFEGKVKIEADYLEEIPFPSCSVRWRECNCHTVKYKKCGRWSCKTKKKTVCSQCPEFYDCPPDSFFKERNFNHDLYLRLDYNGFHASFE